MFCNWYGEIVASSSLSSFHKAWLTQNLKAEQFSRTCVLNAFYRPRKSCFNCGGDHNLNNCKEPKNHKRIAESRQQFMQQFTPSTGLQQKQRYLHIAVRIEFCVWQNNSWPYTLQYMRFPCCFDCSLGIPSWSVCLTAVNRSCMLLGCELEFATYVYTTVTSVRLINELWWKYYI